MVIEFLFFLITALWILEFIVFKSRKTDDANSQDHTTFPWIMTSVVIVIVLSIFSREVSFFTIEATGLEWAGLVLYAMGVSVRYWGIRKLGLQFTRDVNVINNDQIVSDGPFKFLRHPLYTGLFFALIGITMYMGSIAGFIGVFLLFLPFLIKRIQVEEQILIKEFGPEYKEWAASRSRLIPFIY